MALPHRSRAGGGDAQRHYLDLRIRAAALPFAGDQHHVLRFPLGAAGGGAISSWLIPNYGWHSVLLLGAIAPLVLTVLLILLLPESVKYMVNRGQDAAKIKRIAQRFVSQSLDGVTRFYLYEEKLAQTKTSVGLLFSRPYLLGTLMLWLTYFMGW